MPEIIALFIPIVAIISFSPIGKAIAQAILVNSGANSPSNNKMLEIEKKLNEQEEELNKLREIVIFNDKNSIKSVDYSNTLDSTENSHKIKLEKNLS